MSNTRAERLGDQVKKIVARIIDTKVKDPRMGFVTITDVSLSADLEHATLYYTVFGPESEKKGTAGALKSASGMVRSELARYLKIRQIPTIRFIADDVPDTARNLEKMLRLARERDAAIAAQARQAEHAGEMDPYKHSCAEAPDRLESRSD